MLQSHISSIAYSLYREAQLPNSHDILLEILISYSSEDLDPIILHSDVTSSLSTSVDVPLSLELLELLELLGWTGLSVKVADGVLSDTSTPTRG